MLSRIVNIYVGNDPHRRNRRSHISGRVPARPLTAHRSAVCPNHAPHRRPTRDSHSAIPPSTSTQSHRRTSPLRLPTANRSAVLKPHSSSKPPSRSARRSVPASGRHVGLLSCCSGFRSVYAGPAKFVSDCMLTLDWAFVKLGLASATLTVVYEAESGLLPLKKTQYWLNGERSASQVC